MPTDVRPNGVQDTAGTPVTGKRGRRDADDEPPQPPPKRQRLDEMEAKLHSMSQALALLLKGTERVLDYQQEAAQRANVDRALTVIGCMHNVR